MQKKFSYYIVSGFLLCAILGIVYFFQRKNTVPTYRLPVYGPSSNGNKIARTNHKIPYFSFTDQEGNIFTSDSARNKITVVDYFFTTCQSICPVMSRQMERVAASFSTDSEILILSHTVNPETDSVAVLKAYSLLHKADYSKWKFLTGNKSDLYRLARRGYLLDAIENTNANEAEADFIHTQNFVLVDKNKQIRGFYDGTDSLEVSRLIKEIRILRTE